MNKKLTISVLAGTLLSALALYLAFRNVPFAELMTYLSGIRYIWLLPTAALMVLTFVLRTWRWQIILKSAGRVGYWQAFHPLMTGFMINCILPGRLGEVARPAILKKNRQVPLTTGLATVAAERVFDMLVLIGLLAMVFTTISGSEGLAVQFGRFRLDQQALVAVAANMIRLAVLLAAGVVLVSIDATRALIQKAVSWCFGLSAGPVAPRGRRQRLGVLINRLIDHFATGLALIKSPARLGACLVLTVLIWAITAVSYYVFAMGSPGVSLTMVQWTTVMVIICFFIALPSVPGFWGLWEAGGVFAMSLFAIPASEAAGFTLVNHAVQIVPVIAIGLVSAWISGVNIWRIAMPGQAAAGKAAGFKLSSKAGDVEPSPTLETRT